MLWILLTGAWASPQWTVDGTSLELVRGRESVSQLACPPFSPGGSTLLGRDLTTLGVAVVAYSKKQGTMTWGHASLRAVFCLDDELFDIEYETYRLSGWNESMLREEHRGEAFADSEWLTSQRGALVLFRNLDPVDRGWYGEAQARNREIYEVWLDLNPEELNGVVVSAEAAYRDQLERMRRYEPFPEPYRVWSRNCTVPFYDFLPEGLIDGSPITPFAWVRKLAPDARALVVHPSHHLVNRWGGQLPAAIDKPSPVFRRPKRLSSDARLALQRSLADAEPVIPMAVDSSGVHPLPDASAVLE